MTRLLKEKMRMIGAKVGIIIVCAFLVLPLTERAMGQMSLPILGGDTIEKQLPTPSELQGKSNLSTTNPTSIDPDTTAKFVQGLILRVIRLVLIGIQIAAIIYIVSMGIQMMVHMEKEDMFAKYRQSLINALIGFIIMSVGDNAIEVFNPYAHDVTGTAVTVKQTLFDFSSWQGIVSLVKDIIKYSVWTIGVVILVVIGVKMVISQDKDTKAEQKLLTNVALGLFIMQIADMIITPFLTNTATSVNPNAPAPLAGTATSAAQGVEQGSGLLLNVANVLLYLFAPLAILGIIVSSFYLLTGGEEKKKRAKSTLIGIVFATIVAYSSYTVVAEIVKAFPGFLGS